MDELCPKCRHAVPAPSGETSRYRCGNCGHRWRADIGPPTTPQGVPAPPPATYPPPESSEGWAVASLVCGLVFFVPFIAQILAFVFGVVAFRRIHPGEGHSSPRIMAGTGMGCALLAGILWIWLGVYYMQITGPMPAAAVPTGAGTATAPAPLVGLGYAAGYAGAAPSSRMPLGQVTETEFKAKEILRALTMYRQDFRRWPKTINDLIPTYLSRENLRLDQAFDVFGQELKSPRSGEKLFNYVPPPSGSATTDEKRILFYSLRFDLDNQGDALEVPKRWVIWSNNVIEFLEEATIAEALGVAVDDLSIEP